ncbi:hypothetical protein [uncultured Gammaproteobacteria bacterium]|jgi:hypothetical protein|nr:hypothetical protein [uncultured Gammaproteobacteria bacterium]CAC9538430.1 hypothetical protein [uncultured Gammaproteobacteria bacterium]CAC9549959.1 hypothetical protein [uncultured Gammaproteobacteria bacterium]
MRTMRTIKLSILSLLLFGSFSVLAVSASVKQCSKIDGEDIANSIYTASPNATCRCDNGYKEMPKLKKTSEDPKDPKDPEAEAPEIPDTFSGGCVFKDNKSTNISPAAWAVPLATIGFATTSAGGYYIYRCCKPGIIKPVLEPPPLRPPVPETDDMVEIDLNSDTGIDTLGGEIRGIANQEFFGDDGGYATVSEFNVIRNDYNPEILPSSSSDMNMTELDYSLPKPLDELPIEESHYATVEDAIPPGQSPNPPHVDDEIGGGGAGGDAGEPIYAQVRKKMFRNKWKNESIEESDRVEEPDQIEETNFDDFSDQVSNVKENIIEEIELDDMDGANIGEYFPEESFADPGIPVEANVTIRVPSNYTDVNEWNNSQQLDNDKDVETSDC